LCVHDLSPDLMSLFIRAPGRMVAKKKPARVRRLFQDETRDC